jgi:hypothetical protein
MKITTLSLALLSAVAAPAPFSVTVVGPSGESMEWTAATLEKLPVQEIEAVDPHSRAKARYTCVALSELLARAGAPHGEDLRGPSLASYVLVEARDGYRVIFSLAELDPGIRDQDACLAFKKDGAPLADDVGPFRLVVPSDHRGARWVRQVARATVVSLPK